MNARIMRQLALALGLLVGCGSTKQRDAGSDASLCTPARDPDGGLCDHPRELLTSRKAYAHAKAAVGDAAVVVLISDSADVDGAAATWTFTFVTADNASTLAVVVRAGDVQVMSPMPNDPTQCTTKDTFVVLDSRAIIHDAVRRFEERTGSTFALGRNGMLFFDEITCSDEWLPEGHRVDFTYWKSADHSQPPAYYFARYRGDGRFIELAGPCKMPDLLDCLSGDAP